MIFSLHVPVNESLEEIKQTLKVLRKQEKTTLDKLERQLVEKKIILKDSEVSDVKVYFGEIIEHQCNPHKHVILGAGRQQDDGQCVRNHPEK